jgi:2,4-dienoyl-CoA reductase-like NADH-dependent reductase (Old Yellow Enzyme family)|tara:strand:+ start:1707 stop:2846 length:1140 start_codon:yes stop_codon:yes gene_type:complete
MQIVKDSLDPVLFTPLQLRQLQIQNRVMVSPMCQYSATEGSPGPWHHMHLGQFAASGVGLLCIEMTNIEAAGRITPYCMGLYSDDNESALRQVVNFCKDVADTPIALQLAHAGRKASSARPWEGRKPILPSDGGWEVVAPSAIALQDGAPVPRELGSTEISDMVNKFADAARRAERIGIDALELHAAHGYLLHEFLSPISNRRTDNYGGSLDNRMRFVLEVFEATRAAWPVTKPLGIRLSATDWIDGGWDIDQSIALCKLLKQSGCDWIDVSSGGLAPDQVVPVGPGYQVPLSERIRQETGLITIAVGLITEPRQAETILSEGKADMVALGRGMLYNPRWVWHAADQLGAQIKYPQQYQRCRPSQHDDVFGERNATSTR